MIGGATTSRAHTAVKIAPEYEGTIVHVNDASRAVTIAGELSGDKDEDYFAFAKAKKEEYSKLRDEFLGRAKKKDFLTIEQAREHKFPIDWSSYEAVKPKKLGVHELEDLDLKEISEYIDWSPFFRSWDLHGRYPDILTDEVVGEQATELFADAQEMLKKIIDENWLEAKALYGLFPANSNEQDDIEVQRN